MTEVSKPSKVFSKIGGKRSVEKKQPPDQARKARASLLLH